MNRPKFVISLPLTFNTSRESGKYVPLKLVNLLLFKYNNSSDSGNIAFSKLVILLLYKYKLLSKWENFTPSKLVISLLLKSNNVRDLGNLYLLKSSFVKFLSDKSS